MFYTVIRSSLMDPKSISQGLVLLGALDYDRRVLRDGSSFSQMNMEGQLSLKAVHT